MKKEFPQLTKEDIKQLEDYGTNHKMYNRAYVNSDSSDRSMVHILYFEYKTFENQVYKVKQTASGAEKSIQKTDEFNPPKDSRSRFEKVQRSIECLYCGVKIVGQDKILRWNKAINMTRTPEAVASRLARDLTETDPRRLEEILTRLQTARNNLQQQRLRSGRNIGIGTGLLGQQIGLATGRGASE